MFEQFRSFMADIGYPPDKIRALTFATYGDYAQAYLNRKVMLMTIGWTMDYPDAENTVQLFYGPNASPGSNSANYNNEEFNRLYQASSTMQPSPIRTAMYRNMNRIVIEDCATISGISRKIDPALEPGSRHAAGSLVPGGPFFPLRRSRRNQQQERGAQ